MADDRATIQKDAADLMEKMDNDAAVRGEYYVAAAIVLLARAILQAGVNIAARSR